MVAAAPEGYHRGVELRYSGHSVYRTEYHIVWVTKYRRRVLNPGAAGYLGKLFPKVMERLPGCEIVTQTIQVDHVHVVMVIPPRYAVSDVVGRLKAWTGAEMRKKLPWIRKVYWRENVLWSEGYFVSTVGIDEAKTLKYVQWQGRQDSGQAKLALF